MTAPALPTGWTAINDTIGKPDPTLWVTATDTPDTAPNAAFIPDQDGISDKYLYTPRFTITSTSAHLSFRNNYNTEYDPPPMEVFWDGGVLEVSSPNISNGDFIDVTDPRDRNYFYSVYFRTPAGAMFEATRSHPAGFLKDEELDSLGSCLQLPAWLEDRQEELLAELDRLQPLS